MNFFLLLVLLLFPLASMQQGNGTRSAVNSTYFGNMAALNSKIAASKPIFVYINATTMLYKERKIDMTFEAYQQQPALLFLQPYVYFFTFSRITDRFVFFEANWRPQAEQHMITRITNNTEIIQADELVFAVADTIEDLFNSVRKIVKNNIKTTLGERGYQICISSSDEKFGYIKNVEIPTYEAGITVREYVYLCARYDKGELIWLRVPEPSIVAIIQIVLHIARFLLAFAFITFVNARLKYFRMKKVYCEHVTTAYVLPPFYILDLMPQIRTFMVDIRIWMVLLLISSNILIYALAMMHMWTPLEWPKESDGSSHYSSIFTRYDSYLFRFVVISCPIAIALNLITTAIKLLFPLKNLKITTTNKCVSYGEKVFRFFLAVGIAIGMGFLWKMVNYYAYTIRNYKDAIVSVMQSLLTIVIVFYFLLRPLMDWTYYKRKLMRQAIVQRLRTSISRLEPTELKDELLQSPGDDVMDSAYIKATDTPENQTMVIQSLRKTSVLAYYWKYLIPTWICESVWLVTMYYVSYLAATTVTRFIWSTLMLFFLYPELMQIYVYILTVFITVWRFWSELNEPYGKVKAYLMNNRTVHTVRSVQRFNQRILGLSTEERYKRKQGQETTYAMTFMPMSLFHELCHLSNVFYLVKATLARFFLTLFILSLFVFGTFIFSSISGSQDKLITLLASSLMPLLPQVITVVFNKMNDNESSVLNARIKGNLRLLERRHTPRGLPYDLYHQFAILASKPPKLTQDGIPHIDEIVSEEKSYYKD